MYGCNTCFLVSNANALMYKIFLILWKSTLACSTLLMTTVLLLPSIIGHVPKVFEVLIVEIKLAGFAAVKYIYRGP
jgi:hypothetical protein